MKIIPEYIVTCFTVQYVVETFTCVACEGCSVIDHVTYVVQMFLQLLSSLF